jgi:hypothetical protein
MYNRHEEKIKKLTVKVDDKPSDKKREFDPNIFK